jgi:hypothetical protein
MNEESIGRELAVEFHRLMEHEPPFRTDLGESLRAAECAGRRRRARTRAVRGGSGLLAIAASAALVLAWPDHDRALNPPPAVVIPTEVTPTVQPLGTVDRLERMAREIARPSSGTVEVDSDAALAEVRATVKTKDGSFTVYANVSSENDAQTWRESCRFDGSTCTELSFTSTVGVWARRYPSRPGRENLRLVASAPGGKSLSVVIDNYVEVAGGAKKVGPRRKDVGITASGVRQAVADSGLTTAAGN